MAGKKEWGGCQVSQGERMEGQEEGRAAFRQKGAEIVVAALFFLAGAIVVYDSLRLGAKWAQDGPEAGYFPLIIGLIICIAAVIKLLAGICPARDIGPNLLQVGALQPVPFAVLANPR